MLVHIEKSAYAFKLNGEPVSCEVCGSGHINTTVKITTDTGAEYVLQRINKYVFKDPVRLMDNIGAVTEYLRQRVTDPRMALHFIPAYDGRYYHVDEEGEYWRMYDFVGGFCLDMPETKEDFYESALAFGRFQSMLAGFPADTLFETLPEFHNTINRYRQFKEVVAKDPCGRLAGVKAEVDFLLEREELGGTLQRMRESGELPLRVTHNDTKINNVLFHPETSDAMIVIDLDTVMPGLMGHDFGDAIRFAANFVEEDCPDLDKVGVNLEIFRAFAEGFLSKTAKTMTDKEVETLALSCFVLTAELATRFLADYLDGDLYFNIKSPDHNLVRTRCQIALAKDMLKKMDEMEQIVRDCVAAAK